MEFFQIFRFGGTIAVNRLSVRDMFAIGFISIIVYIILVALISIILPTILFGLYVIWMITNNGFGCENNVRQRLILNLMTIFSVIYYLLDFHFGWISFQIMGGDVISKPTLDGVASYNLTIGILSLILFFVGHEIYRIGESHLLSIILFISIIYFGFKIITPISDSIISNVITQSDPIVYVHELDEEELETQERLRQFDEDYANGKIIDFNI